jgi:DNA-binding MarR family transcriptional regulator
VSRRTPDEPVPWLSDDERPAWLALTALLMTLPPAIDAQLKRDAGLNFFEYSILAALSTSDGQAMRMSMLAQFAAGSLSRLSHAVTRLERQGWVRRRVRTGETRCTEAVLTKAGAALLRSAAPDHVREARRLVFDPLSPAQQRQLLAICRSLVRTGAPEIADMLDEAIARPR